MRSISGPWTVGSLLLQKSQEIPNKIFLETLNGETQTYAEVWQEVERMASTLRANGVQKGDVVVIMMRNGLAAVRAWFGVNAIGAIDAAINTGYHSGSFEHALNQVQAKYLIIAEEFLPVLNASLPFLKCLRTVIVMGRVSADVCVDSIRYINGMDSHQSHALNLHDAPLRQSDIASIIFTSGTSGPAKGVMMPHAQVLLLAKQTAKNLGIREDDIYYSFHPLYHMAGKYMQVLACAVSGAKLVLDEAFDAKYWLDRVQRCGATLSGAHGPMLEMIFAQPESAEDKNHRLRAICSAPFPRHIAEKFESRFNTRGLEVWGMTEVGIPLWNSLDEPLRAGSCGKADREWFDFQIVDSATDEPVEIGEVGEFVVRHKHPWTMMQGYVGMPDKTVESWRNLWFHTGDSGYMDDAGYVYFADRTADRIRRRAENISSYEIEVAALRHPQIAEAAAVGTPSEYAGDDDILLCIVPKPGNQPDPLELLRHLTVLLPHFMVPRYVSILESLPRSATQKVQRAMLKNLPQESNVWDRKAHGIALRDIKESK